MAAERKLTLDEIINAVRDGDHPDYEDLRYAICAMSALMAFDTSAFMTMARGEQEDKPRKLIYSSLFQYEEHFYRHKRAMAVSPKQYVGWDNDPDNPEFLRRRGIAVNLTNKIINKLNNTDGEQSS